MAIGFDSAFGIHDEALVLRARRAGVLAANLANADTPNFKARDIDFKAELARTLDASQPSRMAVTHAAHVRGGADASVSRMYRAPVQPSLDGNTVDTQLEQARFMDNALRYQASLQFLSGRIRGLLGAIKGE